MSIWKLSNVRQQKASFSWGHNAGSGRCVIAGGYVSPGNVDTIDKFNLNSSANATDFGDLLAANREAGGANSRTVGLFAGGVSPTTQIQSIVIHTDGNAADYADLTQSTKGPQGFSDNVKAIFGGGEGPSGDTNVIQSTFISSFGNCVDFGDLTTARDECSDSGATNGTRGIFSGGHAGGRSNVIDFITNATAGNAADFGDLTASKDGIKASQSKTRAFTLGGSTGSGSSDIEMVNFASTGNATDVGDLDSARQYGSACDNSIVGFYAGGNNAGGMTNSITTFNQITMGGATDFADLSQSRNGHMVAFSDGQGGLSDFNIGREEYPEYYKNAQAGKIAILGPGDTSHFNIQYKNMHSTGNCVDFGHTIGIRRHAGVGSDKTTAIFLGGYDPSAYTNDIETVIFSSKGNAAVWGDLTTARNHSGAMGNSTRCLSHDARAPSEVTVDYITWATKGNAQDFGDCLVNRGQAGSGADATRGYLYGGATGPSELASIDYFTIASTGNATDFGDIGSGAQNNAQGGSSSTRGVHGGGYNGSDQKENTISYITIQTTGDSTDFGDLTVARADQAGASNGVRVGWFGGDGDQTTCDFVTIATTGNATDFGDTNVVGRNFRATAEFHGGINA